MDKSAVVRSLTELLTIAKVAMPHEVYAIDPRIARANKLLGVLTASGALRVPTVAQRKPDKLDEIISMLEDDGKAGG